MRAEPSAESDFFLRGNTAMAAARSAPLPAGPALPPLAGARRARPPLLRRRPRGLLRRRKPGQVSAVLRQPGVRGRLRRRGALRCHSQALLLRCRAEGQRKHRAAPPPRASASAGERGERAGGHGVRSIGRMIASITVSYLR